MKKAELLKALAALQSQFEARQVTQAEAENFLESLELVMTNQLKQGKDVVVPGLGRFQTRHRAGRIGRNPQTGEPVTIPAARNVKFSVTKSLKEAVNA
ncbi:MAG: HU family DNA-binding protein [Nitrincola lacisaponensis]|uniref:HU family DNA-binding protein n=1 Tax=Nitrincola lacisaponensis TaxID=267850 RepID=UPI00391DBA26